MKYLYVDLSSIFNFLIFTFAYFILSCEKAYWNSFYLNKNWRKVLFYFITCSLDYSVVKYSRKDVLKSNLSQQKVQKLVSLKLRSHAEMSIRFILFCNLELNNFSISLFIFIYNFFICTLLFHEFMRFSYFGSFLPVLPKFYENKTF